MAGLYVHIPFCLSKCDYCDFASFPIKSFEPQTARAYVSALMREAEAWRGLRFETVYIGGGTPSVLGAELIEELLSGLNRLKIEPDAEWTIELNPGAVDRPTLDAAKACGVNRLSIGLQATQDELLKGIGRGHTVRQALEAFELARTAGFDNINLDVMYGLPYQSADDFEATLKLIQSLDPEHISAYSLILEEGTRLYDREGLVLPDEETVSNMESLLKTLPYERYEVSNYAKPGRKCLHNINYWLCGDYIGLGVAAHSHVGSRRWENVRSVGEYLASGSPLLKEEHITADDAEFETVMMGLRMTEGIPARHFVAKHGISAEEAFPQWKGLRERGLLSDDDGWYRLTERGYEVMNSILTLLMGDK